jgi:hypothetical protein
MKGSSEYQVLENRRDTGFIRGLSSCANNRSVAADFLGFAQLALGEAGTVYLWQDDYIAALAETDPTKQLRLVYQAMVALEQRRLSPLEPGSEEHQAVERAEKALQILKTSLTDD